MAEIYTQVQAYHRKPLPPARMWTVQNRTSYTRANSDSPPVANMCTKPEYGTKQHKNESVPDRGGPVGGGPKMSLACLIVGVSLCLLLGACPLSMTWQIVSCGLLNSLVLVGGIHSISTCALLFLLFLIQQRADSQCLLLLSEDNHLLLLVFNPWYCILWINWHYRKFC